MILSLSHKHISTSEIISKNSLKEKVWKTNWQKFWSCHCHLEMVLTGWAWHTRAMSSLDAPYSIASAASLISSPAAGAIMWHPRRRSVSLSDRTFTIPSISAFVRARLFAERGNFPILYATPWKNDNTFNGVRSVRKRFTRRKIFKDWNRPVFCRLNHPTFWIASGSFWDWLVFG